MGYVAVALITLGAVNSIVAMNVETCTGGVADSLMGGIYTALLYALGFGLILWRRSTPWLFVSLVPAILVAIWHTKFSVAFAAGYWLHDVGACFAMGIYPPEASDALDGRESFQSILWAGLSLIFWLGLIGGFARNQFKKHIKLSMTTCHPSDLPCGRASLHR